MRGLIMLAGCVLLAFFVLRAIMAGRQGGFPRLRDLPLAHESVPAAAEKIRPILSAQLAHRGAVAKDVTFLVDLNPQLDLEAFGEILDARGLGWTALSRREPLLKALELVAASAQEDLLRSLEEMRLQGRVVRYDAFRIVSRVAVVARDPAVVTELAERGDVVSLVETRRWTGDIPTQPPVTTGPQAVVPAESIGGERTSEPADPVEPESWAVAAIRAPAAWARGYDGRGVVVGLLDTGASRDHDQLRDNWRGAEPGREGDSWYHPLKADIPEPIDTSGHGSGVIAAAVGMNRPLRDGTPCVVGVAPGAQWVAAVAYPSDVLDLLAFTAAADWMLFRARPDIVVHTYTCAPEDLDPRAKRIFATFKAAETLVLFAAGNQGPERGRNFAPPHVAKLGPHGVPAFSVGATARDGSVAATSARGPSADDLVSPFPQVVAPGEDLAVVFPLQPDALIRGAGTSYAVGYAAGAAAILRQAAPSLRVNAIEWCLKSTARNIGRGQPNNDAGWGLIDVESALDRALADEEALTAPRTP